MFLVFFGVGGRVSVMLWFVIFGGGGWRGWGVRRVMGGSVGDVFSLVFFFESFVMCCVFHFGVGCYHL